MTLDNLAGVFTEDVFCADDDCLNELAKFHCPYSDTLCNEHCGHEH